MISPDFRDFRGKGNLYLTHHGIEGQKWGVRNGPPYPIDRSKKNNTEYGKIHAYTSPLINTIINTARAYSDPIYLARLSANTIHQLWPKDYTKKEGDFEKISQLKKKSEQTSIRDDVKSVNPRSPITPQIGKRNNCVYCTNAMELRSRGYDVIARSSDVGKTRLDWYSWYSKIQFNGLIIPRKEMELRRTYINRSFDRLCEDIKNKAGEGSRGCFQFRYEGLNSGHSVFWKVENGQVYFYDGQNKFTNPEKLISLGDPTSYEWARLDNLTLKKGITETVRSNKKKGE